MHCAGYRAEWDANPASKGPSTQWQEEAHHNVHCNFEINESFRRDEDKHCESRRGGSHRRPAHMSGDVRRQVTWEKLGRREIPDASWEEPGMHFRDGKSWSREVVEEKSTIYFIPTANQPK